MSTPYKQPRFEWDYNLAQTKSDFDKFFANTNTDMDRKIPTKKANELDLASWNIAHLGTQKRRAKDLKLIAHIISKFDVIAIQELKANLGHFNKIMSELGSDFDMVMTDTAGNSERLAVIYRPARVQPKQLFGELDHNPDGKIVDGKYTIPPFKEDFTCKGKKYYLEFYNFNRNPFLCSWQVVGRNKSFLLANCHIYYGDKTKTSAQFINRVAEVFYLANWARKQQKDKSHAYEKNTILIGDMNVPKTDSKDPVYKALKRRGMKPSKYATIVGERIPDFKFFDQIVFTNDKLKVTKIQKRDAVVVDYDNFIFHDLWADVEAKKRTRKQFRAWLHFALSDHRPLFVRLKV